MVLAMLMQNPGRIVSKEPIETRLYGTIGKKNGKRRGGSHLSLAAAPNSGRRQPAHSHHAQRRLFHLVLSPHLIPVP